jgi:hypothetical protein
LKYYPGICLEGLKIGMVNLGRYYDVAYCSTNEMIKLGLQIQRFRVRFPALPDFLRGSGSGTGSTQPRELVSITEELLGRNSTGSGQENREYDRGDPLR